MVSCVFIDDKLKWCDYISYVNDKVSKGLGLIFKARMFVDKNVYVPFTIHLFIPT